MKVELTQTQDRATFSSDTDYIYSMKPSGRRILLNECSKSGGSRIDGVWQALSVILSSNFDPKVLVIESRTSRSSSRTKSCITVDSISFVRIMTIYDNNNFMTIIIIIILIKWNIR